MKKLLYILSICAGALVEWFMLKTGIAMGMAKITFGQIVSDVRGKIAGMVFAKGHYGNYIRTKATPINPNSLAQSNVRNYMTLASRAWKALTDAQRLQWSGPQYAQSKNNQIGGSKSLTGFNTFVQAYLNLKTIGIAPLTDYEGADTPANFTALSGTLAYGPDVMEMVFAPAILAADNVIVYATAPHSVGVNFVKSEFRQIAVINSGAISPFDITTAYTDVFGQIPLAGEACHIKVRPIRKATGRSGSELSSKLK